MAEIAIYASVVLLDKIISRLSDLALTTSHYDVDTTKNILITMQAYLKDTEGTEATEGLKDRVQRVRDVAYEIEDAMEDFMFHVPEHFHDHTITKILHVVAHSVTDSVPLRRLCSRMEKIQKKINEIPSTDTLRKQASSSDGCQRRYKFGDIEKCYHSLSPNLRYCLLYFCNFPADYHVTRGRLVRLWTAERFLEESRSRTKEEIADEYLNELMGRNLIDVHGRDVVGRVKRCQVFPPVRDFILDESEKIRFCTVLPRPNGIISIEESRRLSLHNPSTNLRREDLSSIRTLMTFRRDAEFKAEDLLRKFKLLRVLDFEDSALQSFPEEVVKLTLLRYLSLRKTNINTIPGCIKKLHSLEVLDLRQTCVIELPKQILKLRNLLHLLVDQRLGLNEAREGVRLPSELKCLSSLQQLSLLKANEKNRRIIIELGNLIDLRKLGIAELEEEAGVDLCRSIQNMEYLSSLSVTSTRDGEELLDLNDLSKPPPSLRRLSLGGRLLHIPEWIRQLHSLARICLKGSKLERSPLEALRALPSLVELRLVDAYMGEELVFEPKYFQVLRVLYLEQLRGLRKISLKSHKALPQLVRMLCLEQLRGSRKISVKSRKALPQLGKLVLKGFDDKLPKVPSRLRKLISKE